MRHSTLTLFAGALMIAAAPAALAQNVPGATSGAGTTTGTVPAPSAIEGSVDTPHRGTTRRPPAGTAGAPDASSGTATDQAGPDASPSATAPAPGQDLAEPDPGVVGRTPSILMDGEGAGDSEVDMGGTPGATIPGAETDAVDVTPGLTTDSVASDPAATTGSIGLAGGAMTEEEIRHELEARGFDSVEDVEGPFFTATAERDGEEVELRVDARTGEIVEPAD